MNLKPEEKGLRMSFYLEDRYEELHYVDFYREVFGNYLETAEQRDNREKYTYAAIVKVTYSEKESVKNSTKKFLVTDDLVALGDAISEEGGKTLMSMADYVGKSAKMQYAVRLYGFAIDLDNLKFGKNGELFGIGSLIKQWTVLDDYMPIPTLMASSGSGLHLYYVFEEPIRLNRVSIKELTKLKRGLTERIWNSDVTESFESIQQEPIFQDMRIVGSINKYGGVVRGFKIGKKVSISYLNQFVRDRYKADFVTTKVSLKEAQEKWKEWYQERIIEGKQKKNNLDRKWHINKNKKHGDKLALFHWWEKIAFDLGRVGHRYNCLKILAIMANKNEVPEEEFLRAFKRLAEKFESLTNDEANHLTKDDISAARKFFGNYNYDTYPVDVIRYRSAIDFKSSKRNGRKQEAHLGRIRATQKYDYPNGEWRNKDGAPKKKDIVFGWRKNNPTGKKIDCQRETGLSRPTVLKWWNMKEEQD